MKEYEIVATFLNACAGDAYPQRSFEEPINSIGTQITKW